MLGLLATLALAKPSYDGLIGDPMVKKPELTVQKSDAKSIVVDYSFPGLTVKSVKKGDTEYDLVELEGAGATGTIGAPELPVFTKLFAIPDRAKVIIKSFTPVYKTYQGIYPYPHQDLEYDNPHNTGEWVVDDKYYRQGEVFPDKWVTLGAPAILRDYRVVPVNICPVRVNPQTGEALVLTNLHLELEFTSIPTATSQQLTAENIKTHHFAKSVTSFNKMYGDLIANYDWVNSNGVDVKGSLLIVYPNVTNVSTILQPLIDWKKRLGYATTAVSVSNGASTTTVQNIVQTAYNTYNPPLEALIIVGDATGSIDINCYSYGGFPYSGDTDHQYSLLEGTDILADITVGRISVDGTTTLQTAVNKILYYEKNPTLTSTAWYSKGAVTAGSGSGISTIFAGRSVRDYLLNAGYTQVDTMWYTMGGSISSFITSKCNSGITALEYRGYIGVSGFGSSNVMSLTNTGKLPFATIVTCGTGNFGSGSAAICEAWLRAGSPTNSTGGIGGVGTATSGTHTRYNNTVVLGMWYGFYSGQATSLGTMTFRGKYELFTTYQYDYTGMADFTHWNNLMGDPTTEMWSAVPQQLTVTYEDTIPVGASSFSVTVKDSANVPLADRYVTFWKGTETYLGGRTDANGVFTTPINVPTAGNMYVTVTYRNTYPHQGTVAVVSSAVNPSFNSLTVDDNNIAPSAGNGDGYANPDETLELDVQLKNFGTSTTATGISATLSSSDPGVTINTATRTYANLAPGATAYGSGKFVVTLANYFNQGYLLPLTLTVNSTQGTFVSAFNLQIRSGESIVQSSAFSTGVLDPGETDNLTLTLKNIGQENLTNVTATISTLDNQITIIDNQGSFGAINAGANATNTGNPFSIHADQYATYGHRATLNIHLVSAEGFEQDLTTSIIVGQISSDDPFGPDEYGYYCVDNTDVDYSGHPIYSWVDINTTGAMLGLNDYGSEQDASTRVTLPFDFTFYGQTFDTLTVCSNGWLAFGNQTYHVDFRNGPIPSAGGALNGMLMPLWDDLVMGSGHVYTYNDVANHRFIIEYYNVSYMSGGGTLKFEVILYDPNFYPTPTGDGEIIFQYASFFANYGAGSDNPYFTAGIENHEHTDGLEYAYWNDYAGGAATIASGRAIKFTTVEPVRTPAAPTIDLSLTPVNPPITIPMTGGSFQYTISATNTGTATTAFDLWIMVTMPTGSNIGPLLNVQGLEFAPAQTVTKTKSQSVPGTAPAGIYTYKAYVGEYQIAVWDSASFTFTKTGLDNSGGGEWSVGLWEDNQQSMLDSQQPTEYSLNSAYPNPFNPTTEISYSLPEAGKVTLAVYNTLGRQVAVLEDGFKSAGNYSVKFDGRELTSGIYYYTIKMNGFAQTKKMLLIK
jgi:hypothetical protein